jgi:hypothetical protein
MYKIYVSGHRFFENSKNIRSKISLSLDFFKSKFNQIECYSNLACGADTIFVEEALSKGIPVKIILPFELEEFEKDFANKDLEKFKALISKLPFEIYQKLEDTKQETKNEAYLQAGKSSIENCDALLAVWDGKPAAGVGGTKDHVDYAISLNKDFHWIKAKRPKQKIEQKIQSDQSLSDDFRFHDSEAIRFKNIYQRVWMLGIVFGLFAVLCFAFNFTFASALHLPKLNFILSLAEIMFLILSFFMLSNQSNLYKNIFVSHRSKAEELRGNLWVKETKSIESYFELSILNRSIVEVFFENKQRILWTYAQDQMNYQKNRRIKSFERSLHKNHKTLDFLKYFFFFIVIMLAILEGTHAFELHIHFLDDQTLKNLLAFLWILIPPTFASIEGIIYFNEWKKHINISKELIKYFEKYSSQIINCTEVEKLNLLEQDLYKTFTFDIKNWVDDQKNKIIHGKI